jgi:hypothetical protein
MLCRELDEWFARNNRGKGSSRIDVHQLNGKVWFVIRHGDRFQRVPVVQKDKTEILHFRPEKDDVVVYDEELDELSVHADTKGEKRLYCDKFGFYLRQARCYFTPTRTYSLEPLRTEGEDALSVDDVPGINKVVLREIEYELPGLFESTVIRRSVDIFGEAKCQNEQAIPVTGRLVRAVMDVYFSGSTKPRGVQISDGNLLKIGRHCDAALVNEWLTKRGFRVNQELVAQGSLPLAA